ncbi:DNA ligase [Pseudomonas phage PPpW-4]|uniref:Uncharacterized protein n=1 Tax=Pseudomonas phage PPpW-4 TaxID=1279083 RepID=V5YSY3_9CAUD|nr:DNA ligase [Pseudomonas phage PPpW-4]BAO20680.1 hypothetical protein [Pseudomonas phage PPpW-4]
MSTTFVICFAFACLIAGVWFGFHCNKDIRKEARQKREAAERAAAEEARRGREINDRNVMRNEVIGIFGDLVANPDMLRGSSPTGRNDALRRFLIAHTGLREYAARIRFIEEAQRAAGKERRDILSNQKDIQKALQLWQPVDLVL